MRRRPGVLQGHPQGLAGPVSELVALAQAAGIACPSSELRAGRGGARGPSEHPCGGEQRQGAYEATLRLPVLLRRHTGGGEAVLPCFPGLACLFALMRPFPHAFMALGVCPKRSTGSLALHILICVLSGGSSADYSEG